MTVASYARYSSANQRETSIDDQFRLTGQRAARESWAIVHRFADPETPAGTPLLLRAGGKALMAAIRAKQITILLIESLDRCWRDIVDQERTIREIERLGVRIIGVSDGYDSLREGRELQRVIMGGVNQQYLRDLGKKVHRTLVGQTERGFHAGGLSYGYRSVVAATNNKGEPIGRRLEVDEDRAQWVRFIFERYAEGWAPRRIVYELNRLQVKSPRGSSWAIGAIYGSRRKGTGVLRNELYRGMYIWNRSKWKKDPETGIRQRIKERPREEWKTRECEELRIVPDELWREVQERLNGRKQRGRGKPKRTMLSGILRCEACGGAVTAVDVYNYGCAAAKDRGPTVCTGVRVTRQLLERRVIEIVREELLSDDAVAELRREVAALQASTRRDRETGERTARARLVAIEREIQNLVDAVAVAGWSESLRARLQRAEAERAEIETSLRQAPAEPLPPAMITRLVDQYREMIENLPVVAQREPQAAREALQTLLGDVVLSQDANGGVWAHMPDLNGMLLNVVAGERFYIKKRSETRKFKIA